MAIRNKRINFGGLRNTLSAAFAIYAAVLNIPANADTVEERAQVCTACHGENGIPQDKKIPVIWGQQLGYLYLQLRDFKSGARKNDQMQPIAETLERDDMLALADYFSKKQWPGLRQPQAPQNIVDQAQRLNTSVGCTGCHQGEYQGDGTQPRLAGQGQEYLAQFDA